MRLISAIIALSLLAPVAARPDEVRVVSSGGFAPALRVLAPEWERSSGNHVELLFGPSMGATQDAVPQRLARGERIDVLLMVGAAMGDLVGKGQVVADSRVDLARSLIGAAVRAGAPRPDVSTVEGLKAALLGARSIAYSDSASGVYIEREMFAKLGIAAEVAPKSRMIPAEPVGLVVARGEAELGFQQVSELKPIAGIDQLGPIAPQMQLVTLYSAGVPVNAPTPSVARAFVAFLASPAAAKAIADTGLEPIAKP